MTERSEGWLQNLKGEFDFLRELGIDFVFSPEIKPGWKGDILLSLHEKVLHCRQCPLAEGRTKAVPGEGSFEPELVFVGEAPGADEDLQGRPFVGRAGQLLTKIIEAMKFKREDVYITNVVKCRPPQNRTPLQGEIDKCKAYLIAQVEALQPKVVVTLGKVATEFFVPVDAGMSSLRGKFYNWGNLLVMPTFHPSYIIRNEGNKEIKKVVWQDMQKVMKVLGKK